MNLLFFHFLSPGRRKVLVWIASGWLFYTVFGFFILPLIVRAVAIKQLSKLLDRSVAIEKVRLNPYTLSATIRGVRVKDKDGASLAAWNEAYINFQLSSLFQRDWVFKEVRLSQPFVRLQMNKDYTVTFSDIVNRLWKPVATRPNGVSKGRGLRIDRLRFIDARAALADLTPRVPFRRTIGPFAMTLTHFTTDSDHKNLYALSGRTDVGDRVWWQGFFCLAPFRSAGEFSFQGICLTNYAPLYQDAVRFEIRDGVVSLDSSYRYERSATNHVLSVTNATFTAKSLRVVQGNTGQTMVELSRCLVSGASVDMMARRADAQAVAITGGRLLLVRHKDRSVNVIESAKPAETGPNMPGGIRMLLRAMTNVVAMFLNTTNLSTGTIRDLHLTNCAVHLEDLVNVQPVRLDLEDIAVSARNISNRAGSNMTAEVRMRWETNGTVRAGIRASLSPPAAEVELALDKLNLRPLAAYLEPTLDVFVLGAKLGLAGTFQLRSAREEMPEARFHGDAWLEELSTAEGIETESLLKWKTLRLSGVDANLNPPEVSMAEARLEEASAQWIIQTNHTINLMSALRRGGTNAPAPHPATKVATGPAGPKVFIGSMVLSNANLHFLDRTIQPNVSVTLEQFNGTVSGLSSAAGAGAVVDLHGAIDKTARVQFNGTVNPWNQKLPAELKMELQDLDLLPEDPYSRKYLGYQLKQGALSLDLRYHLVEQKLESQNRITLDHLVLGEKVESPEATRLPVRLAMAILKDRNGRIELEVPVNGSLADPEFQLGKVVSNALGNVFHQIVTSPFSALGALWGGKGQALSFLEFEPGSTNLLPASLEKLEALANGLSDRPELHLVIDVGADLKTDREALRRRKWRNQDRLSEWDGNVATNASPGARLSSNAIVDEKGGSALMRMATPWAEAKLVDREGGRGTALGMTTGELQSLAFDRARNVKAYLLQTGKVQGERISIIESARDNSEQGKPMYFRLQ